MTRERRHVFRSPSSPLLHFLFLFQTSFSKHSAATRLDAASSFCCPTTHFCPPTPIAPSHPQNPLYHLHCSASFFFFFYNHLFFISSSAAVTAICLVDEARTPTTLWMSVQWNKLWLNQLFVHFVWEDDEGEESGGVALRELTQWRQSRWATCRLSKPHKISG